MLASNIAQAVAGTGRFRDVAVGYVRGTPDLTAAASKLSASNLRVYPLFMSDGYYVKRAIPERLGLNQPGPEMRNSDTVIMPPLGVSERMPDVLSALALQTARQAKVSPQDCGVLLVAHGSTKDDCSRRATENLAGRIGRMGVFGRLHTAYLEEPPFLNDQLQNLPGPLIVLGLFIGTGMHGGDDLAVARNTLERTDVLFSSPLAHAPLLRGVIIDDLVKTL